jgi:hypothetical protein
MIISKNSIVLHVSTARQQLACVLYRLHGDSYWTVGGGGKPVASENKNVWIH